MKDQSTDLDKELDRLRILKELSDIVPSWQFVDLTRKGYNDQYIETLKKLLAYLQELLLGDFEEAYKKGYIDGGVAQLTERAKDE